MWHDICSTTNVAAAAAGDGGRGVVSGAGVWVGLGQEASSSFFFFCNDEVAVAGDGDGSLFPFRFLVVVPPLVHQAGGNDQIGAVFDDLTDSVVAVILTVIGFFLAGMYVGLYCTMDECSPILLKMD